MNIENIYKSVVYLLDYEIIKGEKTRANLKKAIYFVGVRP